MHLQQTKSGSRHSGGPQYYFHEIPAHLKKHLRDQGACPVVLRTPYGIASSPFMAVGWHHKLGKDGKVTSGGVGHDRVQGPESIGESIRHWYGLASGDDFETIEVEAEIHRDGHFILTPVSVKMRKRKRADVLERIPQPLSFHKDYQSKLWKRQISLLQQASNVDAGWTAEQIRRIIKEHHDPAATSISEADLLRAAGALSLLGLDLSAYLLDGYDCPRSSFQFARLPRYACPVEIKKRSRDFTYQVKRYAKLPRAVVLCMEHDFVNPPEHIDFVELPALAEYLEAG
jgi:hypothetical protein